MGTVLFFAQLHCRYGSAIMPTILLRCVCETTTTSMQDLPGWIYFWFQTDDLQDILGCDTGCCSSSLQYIRCADTDTEAPYQTHCFLTVHTCLCLFFYSKVYSGNWQKIVFYAHLIFHTFLLRCVAEGCRWTNPTDDFHSWNHFNTLWYCNSPKKIFNNTLLC